MQEQKHFVLVHGAGMGAWVWYKLVTMLKSNGHKVTAIDMAASGIHPKSEKEIASYQDYTEPLIEFMADLPPDERVVLVGHSVGGVCISLAMERFAQKIAVAVFLTAVMPGPEINMDVLHDEHQGQCDSFMDTKLIYGNGEDKPPTTLIYGPEFLTAKMFHLSHPQDVSLAMLLMRPIAACLNEAKLEENALTKENYSSVRRVYCIAEKDNTTKVDLQWWMVGKNPPDEVKVIPDSDHMLMFSNPQELCNCLLEIAENYN